MMVLMDLFAPEFASYGRQLWRGAYQRFLVSFGLAARSAAQGGECLGTFTHTRQQRGYGRYLHTGVSVVSKGERKSKRNRAIFLGLRTYHRRLGQQGPGVRAHPRSRLMYTGGTKRKRKEKKSEADSS